MFIGEITQSMSKNHGRTIRLSKLLSFLVAVLLLTTVTGRRRPGSRAVLSRALRERQQECTRQLTKTADSSISALVNKINPSAPICIFEDGLLEDCMLQCLSLSCREQVYGDDPLEEGEIDNVRAAAFNRCLMEELRMERSR